MPEIVVSELAIYPLKSGAQIKLNSALVDRFGLAYDRRWMVVDTQGHFVSQRTVARMCLIQCQLLENAVQLTAPGRTPIKIATPTSTKTVSVTVWKDQCNVYDCGEAAAQWLSDFLAIECRLVYFPANETRQVDPTFAHADDLTAFSDGFPLLLISQASLDDLNSRLDTPLPMIRFRPNIVVQGCEPFAEDTWHRIAIGDMTFRIVKPCSRCIIPSIDPHTGERGAEPTRTLSQYRRRAHKIYFGQNVIPDGTGEIQVGMPVTILPG